MIASQAKPSVGAGRRTKVISIRDKKWEALVGEEKSTGNWRKAKGAQLGTAGKREGE